MNVKSEKDSETLVPKARIDSKTLRQELINVQNRMQKIKNGPVFWSKEREEEYERLRDLYCQIYQQLSS